MDWKQRLHRDDQHLIEVLESLVPELEQAPGDLGRCFQVSTETHMLPKINEVLEELAKEDHEQFADGRQALGVTIEPTTGHVPDQGGQGIIKQGEQAEDNEESSDEDD
ncbi:uncharacterized protein N0V89_004228 [Didymosphaeria variabile]|uniref:Uncharacterized protein n=1 Tax=Didymosphaeria variabile TaxID=1932322 RepID=A0A9W9CD20_9PLEO|nr:uncharacterized protein N0V89_004228 [Didymosphaeria variabile]KAJ4356198.1 hypothetical protein N0V89_004228 [Didymosphaeria variabile]